MARCVIAPHMRLQEWVAEGKGYFAAEGLEYEFRDEILSKDGKKSTTSATGSALIRLFEKGRQTDVSCACHWTVNVAASNGRGRLYADAYSVSPAGVFVPPESPIREPADLRGLPISMGYQSGSHYSTIQALEQYLKPDEIRLSFADGLLFKRMELLINRQIPAASDVQRTVLLHGAARLPQSDRLDVHDGVDDQRRARPGRCSEVLPRPAACAARHRPASRAVHALLQERVSNPFSGPARRWGPGERIVFEPYTKDVFEESFEWIAQHGIFPHGQMGAGNYEEAVVSLAAK